MSLPTAKPLSSSASSVTYGLDFTDCLNSSDTISSINSVTATPAIVTIASQSIGTATYSDSRTNCAVFFKVTPSATGTCVIEISITDSASETLVKSIVIPVSTYA